MKFREFYEQENLREFSDSSRDASVTKVSSGLGSLASGISKFIGGSFKKAWTSLPISKTLKDMAEKGDKAIEIAKIIYPYPEEKVKYDELKKEGKHKDSKMIASFFTQKVLEQDAMYPIGLNMVYKTYNIVSSMIPRFYKGLAKEKVKLSMQSLLEAAEKERIRFPKLKNLDELNKMVSSKEEKEGSQWNRWIQTATRYSAWKHLYDKVDSESEKSIVSELSNLPNTSSDIQAKIKKLEEDGIEVNAQNIKSFFEKDIDETVRSIIKILGQGSATKIESSKLDIDEQLIKIFLKATLIKPFVRAENAELLANVYSTTSALLQKNNLSALSVHSVFANVDAFISIFKTVNGFDTKNLLGAGTSKTNIIREFLTIYMSMNDKGFNSEVIKEEYIEEPPQQLYDFIYKNVKSKSQEKHEATKK